MPRALATISFALISVAALAQAPKANLEVARYIKVDAARVILTHVRVIDGTGTAAMEDRNVVIEGGRITSVSAGADVEAAKGQTVLDLHGATVLPGLVGMHNHLFHIVR